MSRLVLYKIPTPPKGEAEEPVWVHATMRGLEAMIHYIRSNGLQGQYFIFRDPKTPTLGKAEWGVWAAPLQIELWAEFSPMHRCTSATDGEICHG